MPEQQEEQQQPLNSISKKHRITMVMIGVLELITAIIVIAVVADAANNKDVNMASMPWWGIFVSFI